MSNKTVEEKQRTLALFLGLSILFFVIGCFCFVFIMATGIHLAGFVIGSFWLLFFLIGGDVL